MNKLHTKISKIASQEFYKYKKSEFFSNVLKLFGGNAIAQFISLVTVPIITRLYSPETYGIFGLFTAITGVLGSLVCLQYNRAIVLAETDEDAINISFLCLILSLFFSVGTILIILSFEDDIIRLLGAKESSVWLYFLPVIVLSNGLFLFLQSINIRDKFFGKISKSRIIDALTGRGSAIGLASFGVISPLGLVSGSLIGTVAKTLFLLKSSSYFLVKNSCNISIKKAFNLAKIYRRFPFFLSWAGLLFALNFAIPVWMISYYFSAEYAGQYALVHGILLRPSSLISEAISQPYYQKISRQTVNKEYVHSITKNLMKRLVPGAILLYGVVFLVAPFIFPVIFGESWQLSGKIAQILALYMAVRFCTKSIIMFFSAFRLQHIELILQICSVCLTFFSFALFSSFLSFLEVLIIYSVSNAFVTLSIVVYSYLSVFRIDSGRV